MKIVTVITSVNHPGFKLLRASCRCQNLELVTLKCKQSKYLNNGSKVDLIHNYIDTLDDEELIMFTDGYDTVMLADEMEILTKFHDLNANLVFSSETNCYPDASLRSKYPRKSTGSFIYLNSGGFIGKVKYIKRNIQYYVEPNSDFDSSDQYFWTRRYLSELQDIKLDSNRDLFCTLSPEMGGEGFTSKNMKSYFGYFLNMNKWFNNDFSLSNGRLLCNATNSFPSNLHFNGKAKCLVSNEKLRKILLSIYPEFNSMIEGYVSGINNQLFRDDFSKFLRTPSRI